ncbi:MAG: lactate dehydrogenase [Lachnospiraceae bacterium]|nr:lactate dehydrogenase [Lachnospiraceae bacterium]
MYFYRIGNKTCISFTERRNLQPATGEERKTPEVFLFDRKGDKARASFAVTDVSLLQQESEGAFWLSEGKLKEAAAQSKVQAESLPEEVQEAVRSGKLMAINAEHPQSLEILQGEKRFDFREGAPKKHVHILALGDVGSHLLTGLHLLGGDCISDIGIYDIEEKNMKRWEFEVNQIAYPWDYDRLPAVHLVREENLFDCDVFIFVASAGIPPVDSGVQDVRMVQLEKNKAIITTYARLARERGFRGLFCEVADPVDPLAQAAYYASNTNDQGVFDGKGLLPEQIQGYGLGVMNARAAYYARKDPRFSSFLIQGRAFGPHGQELVIANSIAAYDDALSGELTEKVVGANLEMRSLGFKPFVAPAYSSGAISILETLRGKWHYGSVFFGGIYMGVKNRYTSCGLEHEILPLPDALYARIAAAEAALHAV